MDHQGKVYFEFSFNVSALVSLEATFLQIKKYFKYK